MLNTHVAFKLTFSPTNFFNWFWNIWFEEGDTCQQLNVFSIVPNLQSSLVCLFGPFLVLVLESNFLALELQLETWNNLRSSPASISTINFPTILSRPWFCNTWGRWRKLLTERLFCRSNFQFVVVCYIGPFSMLVLEVMLSWSLAALVAVTPPSVISVAVHRFWLFSIAPNLESSWYVKLGLSQH